MIGHASLRQAVEPRREKKIKSWSRTDKPDSEQNKRPIPPFKINLVNEDKATEPLPVETIP